MTGDDWFDWEISNRSPGSWLCRTKREAIAAIELTREHLISVVCWWSMWNGEVPTGDQYPVWTALLAKQAETLAEN